MNSAISLEIRLLAALFPPIISFKIDTMKRGANAVRLSILPPATSESGDRSPIKNFLVWGGGGITLPGV